MISQTTLVRAFAYTHLGDAIVAPATDIAAAANSLAAICEHPYLRWQVLDIGKRAGYHDIKKAFLKAKKESEEGKSSYDLAEIKEAFDIMSHPGPPMPQP